MKRIIGACAAAFALLVTAGPVSAQPGISSGGYRTYGVGNQRYAYVQGVLNPLVQGQVYVGTWIRAYDARGNQLSEGQITLLNNLQFSGTLGDFQMASFTVVVRYRQGNGPILTREVTQRIPWKP